MSNSSTPTPSGSATFYGRYLLFIAGLGGLLYGIDVGIIAGALKYLEATSGFTPGQLSTVVAAVLLGSVLSSLFAGALADLFGRKAIMILSALLFVASIPIISLSTTFEALVAGRLLQGISGGLIGVVVPLYLAECLSAKTRGKGTGMFQFLLTVGLVAAALIGWACSDYVEGIESVATSTEQMIFDAKNYAWRMIFWISIIPGIMFFVGAFFVTESPRWLFRKNKKDAALAALVKSNGDVAGKETLEEMEQTEQEAKSASKAQKVKDSLLSRKYVLPFMIAIIILACNQATGINSVLAYAVNIFSQAGLTGSLGNKGDVLLKVVNCLMTVVAVALVDKKGRKFLLKIGTGGIIVALLGAGFLFRGIEGSQGNIKVQMDTFLASTPALVVDVKNPDVQKDFGIDKEKLEAVLVENGNPKTLAMDLRDSRVQEKLGLDKDVIARSYAIDIANPAVQKALGIDATKNGQIFISYKYGPIANNKFAILDTAKIGDAAKEGRAGNVFVHVVAPSGDALKENVIERFFRGIYLNPFPNPALAEGKPVEIEKATYGDQPGQVTGWLVAGCFILFVATYAAGPGVCVWLALSELMPTRIRSNGMSIALLINQFVSTTIAWVFLPFVGSYGYSTMFLVWAGCTVVYFCTAAFLMPETKGRTLEEIEEHFEGKKKLS